MSGSKHTPGPWKVIDKMNPATWERTGETMPDGAPVLLNPGSGLPCVMPRPIWPNPHIPRSVQVYRSEARDQLDKAAPELLEALPDLSHVIAWLENGCDPLKARYELLIYKERIDAAKAKAEGRS